MDGDEVDESKDDVLCSTIGESDSIDCMECTSFETQKHKMFVIVRRCSK